MLLLNFLLFIDMLFLKYSPTFGHLGDKFENFLTVKFQDEQ